VREDLGLDVPPVEVDLGGLDHALVAEARRLAPSAMATRDPLLPQLADVLRELRQSQGRSQEAVAHHAELTVNAYGNIERGQADPGLTKVARIADALGVSLAELGAALDERRNAAA
jgi:DNA-binding XRE family transcriptional regulator